MSDTTNWQARMPRSVLDLYCPSDHVVTTPTDRRMLWHIESQLGVTAPAGGPLDRLATDLRRYLNETCQHHWHKYNADKDIPAHRQCLWCSDVEWLDGNPEVAP